MNTVPTPTDRERVLAAARAVGRMEALLADGRPIEARFAEMVGHVRDLATVLGLSSAFHHDPGQVADSAATRPPVGLQ